MSDNKTIKFTKMQGLGNDYVYINCFEQNIDQDLTLLAQKISDRNFGIGADGLVLILPSPKADFAMRIFNPDGSEAEMCGNAARCVGKYVFDRGLIKKTTVTLETLTGIKILELLKEGDKVKFVKVDMGEPILIPEKIPVKSKKEGVIVETIEIFDDFFRATCVSMGNPHAVIFVDNIEGIDIKVIGPKIENNSLFPKRTNVEFVKVINNRTIQVRVWERGVGETLACGTGASASVVAAIQNGLCERMVQVKLKGGDLRIEWNEQDNHVYVTGPAEFVFDGEYYVS